MRTEWRKVARFATKYSSFATCSRPSSVSTRNALKPLSTARSFTRAQDRRQIRPVCPTPLHTSQESSQEAPMAAVAHPPWVEGRCLQATELTRSLWVRTRASQRRTLPITRVLVQTPLVWHQEVALAVAPLASAAATPKCTTHTETLRAL